jgi:hypothetical protein
MTTKLLLGAMALAAATLIGLGAAFALGVFEGSDFGQGGTFSGNCREYGTDHLNEQSFNDPYLKGVVSVGFNHGPDGPAAIALLQTLGTSYYMPLPFRDFAFVCVQNGHEDEWANKLKALDWVEFAHKEGVTHCQPNCRLSSP